MTALFHYPTGSQLRRLRSTQSDRIITKHRSEIKYALLRTLVET